MRADRQGLPLHWCLWGLGVVCQMNWRLPYLQPWYPKLPRKGSSVSLLFHRDINFLHRSLVVSFSNANICGKMETHQILPPGKFAPADASHPGMFLYLLETGAFGTDALERVWVHEFG